MLSLAAMMAVASGASFTSTSANAGNVVTAGNLTHSNSKAPGAILNVAGLMPGRSDNGTVDLTNAGDGAGVFTLSRSAVVNSTPATRWARRSTSSSRTSAIRRPRFRPRRSSSTPASSAPWAPSRSAPGPPVETHRYKFTVTFPDGGTPSGPTTGDNAYKGDSVSVTYNWESVSS